jgi:hypothetical protein
VPPFPPLSSAVVLIACCDTIRSLLDSPTALEAFNQVGDSCDAEGSLTNMLLTRSVADVFCFAGWPAARAGHSPERRLGADGRAEDSVPAAPQAVLIQIQS